MAELSELRSHLTAMSEAVRKLVEDCSPYVADVARYGEQLKTRLTSAHALVDSLEAAAEADKMAPLPARAETVEAPTGDSATNPGFTG